MKTVKRERPGGWYTDVRRGRWFAVDRRTGRRIKAHNHTHAIALCEGNNNRELCAVSTVPQAVVWGRE